MHYKLLVGVVKEVNNFKIGLGIMDLSAHSYRTILRSHNEEIRQIEYHKYNKSIITLSSGIKFNVRFDYKSMGYNKF